MMSDRLRFQHPSLLGTVVELTVEFVAVEFSDPGAGSAAGSASGGSPGPDRQAAAERAAEVLFAEVERLQAVFSAFDPDSELCRWRHGSAPGRDPDPANARAGSGFLPEAVGCSNEFGWLMAEALRWQRRTEGLFNPLVGELCDLWAAAEHDAADRPPDAAELLARAESIADSRFTIVDGCPVPTGDCTRLNLNAMAKGHIVDRAIVAAAGVGGLGEAARASRAARVGEAARAAGAAARSSGGVTGLLVNAGGDLRRVGDGTARIGIENPHHPFDNAPPLTVIEIGSEAVATSGGSRQGFTIGGVRYSHVIDPRCGQPAQGSAGVTVVADSAMTADVLATAAVILSPPEAVALIDRLARADSGSDSGLGAASGLIVGHDRSVHPTSLWLDRFGQPPARA